MSPALPAGGADQAMSPSATPAPRFSCGAAAKATKRTASGRGRVGSWMLLPNATFTTWAHVSTRSGATRTPAPTVTLRAFWMATRQLISVLPDLEPFHDPIG